ncbi:MAG: HAMP domain-containing protein [Acidimicrobiales bacterium]|nr:HAMP domain-containing protein [Acidimicrobiales bacterium]
MTKRLVVSYLIVTVFVLVILEVPLGIVYQQRETEQLTNDVERDASVLATLYEEVLENNLTADPTVADEYTGRNGARVVVVDVDGISIIDTAANIDATRDFSTREEIVIALTGSRTSGTRRSDTLNTDLLYVAVPVASGGDIWGAVRVTLDKEEVNERVQRFWVGLALVALVILAIMTGVGWAVARSVTRPVRRLQQAANRFARGELSATEPEGRAPPELRELEDALNTMAGRLDAMLGQQRSFVADASHQLRTPLTAIRLRLENLQSATPDEAGQREIEASISETTRLSELVDDLLALARAERPPQLTTVDLVQTVAERVELWTAVADEAAVSLELDAPQRGLPVTCVDGGLEQILDNLIDNAINAAPSPGGEVKLTVSAGSTVHEVTVADNGPGLDDQQKQRAFDRFWQGRTDTSGTGLGLAIVLSLAKSAGGTVTITDNEPVGLRVGVELPVATN